MLVLPKKYYKWKRILTKYKLNVYKLLHTGNKAKSFKGWHVYNKQKLNKFESHKLLQKLIFIVKSIKSFPKEKFDLQFNSSSNAALVAVLVQF